MGWRGVLLVRRVVFVCVLVYRCIWLGVSRMLPSSSVALLPRNLALHRLCCPCWQFFVWVSPMCARICTGRFAFLYTLCRATGSSSPPFVSPCVLARARFAFFVFGVACVCCPSTLSFMGSVVVPLIRQHCLYSLPLGRASVWHAFVPAAVCACGSSTPFVVQCVVLPLLLQPRLNPLALARAPVLHVFSSASPACVCYQSSLPLLALLLYRC